jgi:hypothetical protein
MKPKLPARRVNWIAAVNLQLSCAPSFGEVAGRVREQRALLHLGVYIQRHRETLGPVAEHNGLFTLREDKVRPGCRWVRSHDRNVALTLPPALVGDVRGGTRRIRHCGVSVEKAAPRPSEPQSIERTEVPWSNRIANACIYQGARPLISRRLSIPREIRVSRCRNQGLWPA